jgi:hypothetical protein
VLNRFAVWVRTGERDDSEPAEIIAGDLPQVETVVEAVEPQPLRQVLGGRAKDRQEIFDSIGARDERGVPVLRKLMHKRKQAFAVIDPRRYDGRAVQRASAMKGAAQACQDAAIAVPCGSRQWVVKVCSDAARHPSIFPLESKT